MPAQTIPSSYTWGGIYDLMRRQGSASVSTSATDQLSIIREISAVCYRFYPWAFSLAQTTLGSIPCQNLVQDYPSPSDLYRLTRAWFYVPTGAGSSVYNPNIVPPYDDPSYAAYQAAVLSQNYVASQQAGGGTPVATIWPQDGSLMVVKRLPPNLFPYTYTQITAITQQPNQTLVRLTGATAVSSSQPYSLELEYQPIRPPVNVPTEQCWFPDDYVSMAMNGIDYRLKLFTNDPRAGTASYSADGSVSYSGQLAVWMASMASAAGAEREGSVDTFTPFSPLGDGGYIGYGAWSF